MSALKLSPTAAVSMSDGPLFGARVGQLPLLLI